MLPPVLWLLPVSSAVLIGFALGGLSGTPLEVDDTASAMGTAAFLVTSLATGFAASVAHRDRWALQELLHAGPGRQRTAAVLTIAAVWGVVALTIVGVNVVMIALRVPVADISFGIRDVSPIFGALGLLLGYTSVGYLLGARARWSTIPILAAVLLWIPPLLPGVSQNFSLVGGKLGEGGVYVPNLHLALGQVVWGVAIGVVAVVLAVARPSVKSGSLFAIASVVVLASSSYVSGQTRSVAENPTLALTCYEGATPICVQPSHVPLQRELARLLTEIQAEATQVDFSYNVSRVQEVSVVDADLAASATSTRFVRTDGDILTSDGRMNAIGRGEFIHFLIQPPKCMGPGAVSAQAYLGAEPLVAWLYLSSQQRSGAAKIPRGDTVVDAVADLTPAARRNWVNTAWHSVERCGQVEVPATDNVPEP